MPLYTLTRGSIGVVVGDRTVEIKKGQTVELSSDEKAKSYSKYLKRADSLEGVATANTTLVPISTATAESNNLSSSASVLTIGDVGSSAVSPPASNQRGLSRDWSTTQDMKVPDVVEMISNTNSMDELGDLQKVEEDGQGRVGVLSAIEKRIKQLEQEG